MTSVAQSGTIRSEAPVANGKPRRNWRRIRRGINQNMPFFLMTLPALAHVILFRYVTLPYILIAFERYRIQDGIFRSKWVGLYNFSFLFGLSEKGWQMTRNVLGYNFTFIVIGTVLSVAVAVLLAEVFKSVWARYYQTLMFIPQFLSWVIIAYIGLAFLHKDTGFVNQLLVQLGRKPVDWYNSPRFWPFILLIAYMWKNLGAAAVIYLAGILRINPEYYEAASIDGANRWQQIRYITLPRLQPLIIILTLLSIGQIFNADFGMFYQFPRYYANLTLIPVLEVIETYVYRAIGGGGGVGSGGGANLEMAAAAGLYQSVVNFVLVVVANWFVRRIDPDRALF